MLTEYLPAGNILSNAAHSLRHRSSGSLSNNRSIHAGTARAEQPAGAICVVSQDGRCGRPQRYARPERA
ncbi:protein of unknown function [Burkholderia multivorans]